jgi:hypothetical protein
LGDGKLRLQALVAARGKIVMVVGHPFYVGGEDTSAGQPGFVALLQLFRDEGVAVVMAGAFNEFTA